MSLIALKIAIVDLNITKTLQFATDKTVEDVLNDITERIGKHLGHDYGLFSPTQSRWLVNSNILSFYDFNSGDLLELKKKHRPLKVRMLDEAIKTVLIDETLPLNQLVAGFCQKIGISNPEEYSLCRDPGNSTPITNDLLSIDKEDLVGTLKRKISGKRRASDPKESRIGEDYDESNWLNPDKFIYEQGLGDNEILVLKKKFFFSDQNVDRNDPVQLNLLYVQSVKGVVSGKYPCTEEDAIFLAALQCQAQFGNHDKDKHQDGFLNLEDFLPLDYARKKNMNEKIFHEHLKLKGMSELNAKYRYVKHCRSLKTYGVTFFPVIEKNPAIRKSKAVLLGVNRDAVIKVNPETKEVVKHWPLKTLRQWISTATTFSLDFGEYSEAMYTVETSDGEKITQLITGYVDMIVKKKNLLENAQKNPISAVPSRRSSIDLKSDEDTQKSQINVTSSQISSLDVHEIQHIEKRPDEIESGRDKVYQEKSGKTSVETPPIITNIMFKCDIDKPQEKLSDKKAIFVIGGATRIGKYLIQNILKDHMKRDYLIGHGDERFFHLATTVAGSDTVMKKLEYEGSLENMISKHLVVNWESIVFVDAREQGTTDSWDLYKFLLSKGDHKLVVGNICCLCSEYEKYQFLEGLHSKVRFEAVIAEGVPISHIVNLVKMSGDIVQRVEFIAPGSTSFILESFYADKEAKFSSIVKMALDKSILSKDIWLDLEGKQLARKLTLISRLFGCKTSLSKVNIVPLMAKPNIWDESDPEFLSTFNDEMEQSLRTNRLWHIGIIEFQTIRNNPNHNNDDIGIEANCKVALEALSPNHCFRNFKGTEGGLLVYTKLIPAGVMLKSTGYTRESVVFSMLSDIGFLCDTKK